MEEYLSNSEQKTKQIAAKLARENKGNVFALTGELGAGKTIFVQGFAKGLGIQEKIISPTFVLIRQHKIPDSKKTLYHIDLYRIAETTNLGLEEILFSQDNIVLIEWAEKLKKLPKGTIKISIQKEGLYSRLISISISPTFSEDKSSINL